MKKKILIVFGTRPEAIKMAPLVKQFLKYPDVFETKVCVTAQHRQMLDQVLQFFEIVPDYDLDIMRQGQDLHTLTADIIIAIQPVLKQLQPDYVFVHGDTTTSTIVALAAFYNKIKVCHIEAGLRTYNKHSPFPEEMNRQLTSKIADLHFAPTNLAAKHLRTEGVDDKCVYVTGNTVIDALFMAREKLKHYEDSEINLLKPLVDTSKKVILITGHRRENFGSGFINICKAIRELSYEPEVQIIYPVHLNPNVQEPVFSTLCNVDNIYLINPVSYPAFIWLMDQTYLIITDSGGVQEEAPSLGKPVLVMRETTERPEAVDAGTVKLVGADTALILAEARNLLNNTTAYNVMSTAHNPYGDGYACSRIVEIMINTY